MAAKPDVASSPETPTLRAVRGQETVFYVFRGEPGGGEMVEYRVPVVEGMVVLDAIHWIQANVDQDLAVRWNCKAAKCGSCSAEINGRPRLMCKTRVDAYPEREIWVQPMKAFPLVKDLVTDVSWNYQVNQADSRVHASCRQARSMVDDAGRRQSSLRIQEVHRVLFVPGCVSCSPRQRR